MNHPIVPLFLMTLFIAGCATSPEGHGRYAQVYRNGVIVMEADAITNAGCKALVTGLKREEESKETFTEGTVITCSSESTPRNALPVKYTWTYASEARPSTMWVWSMVACQGIAAKAKEEDGKVKTSCEVEK